jgi:hypothetical protein
VTPSEGFVCGGAIGSPFPGDSYLCDDSAGQPEALLDRGKDGNCPGQDNPLVNGIWNQLPPCTDGFDCAFDGQTLLECQQNHVIAQQLCEFGCIGNQAGTDHCAQAPTSCTGLPDGSDCDPADTTGNGLLTWAGGQVQGAELSCALGCQLVGNGQDHCKT